MELENSVTFNAVIAEKFIVSRLGEYEYHCLNEKKKELISHVSRLVEYQETGSISKKRKNNEKIVFDGIIGIEMEKFITQNEALNYSQITIKKQKIHLKYFLDYLQTNDINSLTGIN
jgi:radical SAM superfamily enzyme YgiQ (UPF0313 family)